MNKNMGSIDKIIRLVLAAVFIALAKFGVVEGTFAIVLYVAAAIFVVTSVVNFCPLYTLFGINTCKTK